MCCRQFERIPVRPSAPSVPGQSKGLGQPRRSRGKGCLDKNGQINVPRPAWGRGAVHWRSRFRDPGRRPSDYRRYGAGHWQSGSDISGQVPPRWHRLSFRSGQTVIPVQSLPLPAAGKILQARPIRAEALQSFRIPSEVRRSEDECKEIIPLKVFPVPSAAFVQCPDIPPAGSAPPSKAANNPLLRPEGWRIS